MYVLEIVKGARSRVLFTLDNLKADFYNRQGEIESNLKQFYKTLCYFFMFSLQSHLYFYYIIVRNLIVLFSIAYPWFWESFGRECSVLYRENILDYISYLRNIKKDNGRSINCKISALIKYNEFLVANGIQQDQVVSKNDNIKIQQTYANPSDVTKK